MPAIHETEYHTASHPLIALFYQLDVLCRCSKLADHPYIFMRWKEQAFVDAKEDCGLTITGFYYICLSRLDGSIQGLYCDPKSTPYQLLELRPANSHQGHTVGSYQFC